MQLQQPEQQSPAQDCSTRRFADIARGLFFLLGAISIVIVMFMFILVWQPIWQSGFKDFHTISEAIDNLNKTAKPATEVAPLMLVEIEKMNLSVEKMEQTLQTIGKMQGDIEAMRTSIKLIEDINPNIMSINYTMTQMNQILSAQMRRMNYEVDRMGDKFSPFGMMPFNW